jgi:signal transduction histidine kinase
MKKLSIFIKLIAVVLLFGFLLNLSVILIFRVSFDVKPRRYFEAFIKKIETYVVNDIGVPPDTAKAIAICNDLGIKMKYDSKDYTWASDSNMPSFKELMENAPGVKEKYDTHRPFVFRYQGRNFSVIPHPEGGVFIIEPINIDSMLHPERGIIMMLIFITLIIAALYFILRWMFKPMKSLSMAVKQVGEGNYNINLPVERKDELGELAASINDMSKKIGFSIKAKEQLLIDVSHELRTPLTRIKLGLEVGSSKEKINEDVIEMERMISGLLENYRNGNFLGELKPVKTDIGELLNDTIEGFLDSDRIKYRKPEAVISSSVDPEKLEMVFRNVLDNALKYSTGYVEVNLKEQLNDIWITFIDHGTGISDDDLKYIFEPFYRADPSRSKKTGGFGLGLSICRKIMEAHKGEIKIESKINEGTTVTLTLAAV